MAALAYTPLAGPSGRKHGGKGSSVAGRGIQPTLRLVAVPARGGHADASLPVAFRPVIVESPRPAVDEAVAYAPITPLRRESPSIGREVDPAARQRTRRRVHSAKMLRRRIRALAVVGVSLAATFGLWIGTSAVASAAHGQLQILPGAVKTANGYLYRVQPGDTIWSIATRLDPSGDPRPMADAIESELGGTDLQAGMRLLVP